MGINSTDAGTEPAMPDATQPMSDAAQDALIAQLSGASSTGGGVTVEQVAKPEGEATPDANPPTATGDENGADATPNPPAEDPATAFEEEGEGDEDGGEGEPAPATGAGKAEPKVPAHKLPWIKDARNALRETLGGELVDGLSSQEIRIMAMSRARSALARDQWSAEDMKHLPTEKLVRVGLAAAKRQRELDAKFAALKTPEQRGGENRNGNTSASRRDTAPRNEPGTGYNAPGRSGEAIFDSAADQQLGGLLGLVQQSVMDPEAATRLTQGITQLVRRQPSQNQETDQPQPNQQRPQSENHDPAMEEATRRIAQARMRMVVGELSAEFPGIKTDDGLAKFKASMVRLDPRAEALLGDDDDALIQLCRDASRLAFAGDEKTQTKLALLNKNAQTRSGQPRSAATAAKTGSVTPSNYEDAVLALGKQYGNNPAKLQAEIAKLPRPSN